MSYLIPVGTPVRSNGSPRICISFFIFSLCGEAVLNILPGALEYNKSQRC